MMQSVRSSSVEGRNPQLPQQCATETAAFNATTEDERAARGLGLFIVWEKARSQQERILKDLEQNFDLLRVYEVHWTPGLILENFQRFYADMDLRGVYHALTKGTGPFLLITVRDPRPFFALRNTTRGWRTINTRLLEAKMRYRDWTGRFQVHSTETIWETNRDLSMLLGVGADRYRENTEDHWNREIQKLERDLVGAREWQSLSELFWVLNRAVNYVTIHNPLSHDKPRPDSDQPDIDLITDQYWTAHALTNTRQHPSTAPYGGRFPVTVAGAKMHIGIRVAGDGYFDPQWMKYLLKTRTFDQRGFYRPPDNDWFQAVAYHSFVHKADPDRNELERLIGMAKSLQLRDWTGDVLTNPRQAKAVLDRLLQEHGYAYIEPLDKTLFYNKEFVQGQNSPIQRLSGDLSWQLALLKRRLKLALLGRLWRGRDRLILRFPAFRSAKIWLRQFLVK